MCECTSRPEIVCNSEVFLLLLLLKNDNNSKLVGWLVDLRLCVALKTVN